MKRIYVSIENVHGWVNTVSARQIVYIMLETFPKRPSCSNRVHLDVCLKLSLASLRWKPEASGCLKLTSVSSKQIYLTHEPCTFSVTGQTPRRPANSVKITFRKRHLASTDTLTGGGPVSPHQSAARWGPDAIPGPQADPCVQAGTSLPWVTSQILPHSFLPGHDFSRKLKASLGFISKVMPRTTLRTPKKKEGQDMMSCVGVMSKTERRHKPL